MTQMQSTSTHARISEIGQVIVGQDKLIHRTLVYRTTRRISSRPAG